MPVYEPGAVRASTIARAVEGGYETVAASQTAQVLGATGALGDYISSLIIVPLTVAPGLVTLLDNAISIPLWLGGTVDASSSPPSSYLLGSERA